MQIQKFHTSVIHVSETTDMFTENNDLKTLKRFSQHKTS
jgi:hypothetical protein